MHLHLFSSQKPTGRSQSPELSHSKFPNHHLFSGCRKVLTRSTSTPFTLPCTTLALILLFTGVIDEPDLPGVFKSTENAILAEYSECTTALISGFATPDGRPLLWKNRDVQNQYQEYHYVDDGRIPFIGLTYCNDTTFQYYAGVNDVGFAIENSNSYNMGGGCGGNGWDNEDDGEIQALALATCNTVDDFQAILDSLNIAEGRTHCSNYGVFDAFGGAAIFEAGAFQYFRHDAVDTQDGFLVRSNYSYSGNGLDDRGLTWVREDMILPLN